MSHLKHLLFLSCLPVLAPLSGLLDLVTASLGLELMIVREFSFSSQIIIYFFIKKSIFQKVLSTLDTASWL